MPKPAVPLFALSIAAVAMAYAADTRPGQTFPTNGLSIYYEVIGNAPGTPLIVANGGPGFDHTYMHLSDAWERFGKTRKVVSYDQRGNGRSSKLTAGQSCTLRDQIEDLDALRAHVGADRIDLLGHSWGGYRVMAYAGH